MSALNELLNIFRAASQTEREKGTYFEELMVAYFRTEPYYKELYSQVWLYSDWAKETGIDARDTGIDLVAQAAGTGDVHAIQCKFYSEDAKVAKSQIDSFFTASGKRPFTHRIIVTTTNEWSVHAEESLRDQHIPVTKIDLIALSESCIDWAQFAKLKAPVIKPKKKPRSHQELALNAVVKGLAAADRGKLIMACGTGKTFTSLKIAETIAGKGKRVLFLVPSLSLLSQSLTEWTQESDIPLASFAVCSDGDIGKKRDKSDEDVETFMHELRYPATTDAKRLFQSVTVRHADDHMTVVFATYHSIEVIHQAQRLGMPAFDLILCDEAHRTTGSTFAGQEDSPFVRVHNAAYIQGAKRLYMTATPRIFGEKAKGTADVVLFGMDDESLYGKELFVLNFSEAVSRGLLVDYKVVVLTVSAEDIEGKLAGRFGASDLNVVADDAAKIVGCWKALAKHGLTKDETDDSEYMKRAVAFCQVIAPSTAKGKHKVSSMNIADMFQRVVEAYQEAESEKEEGDTTSLICEARHVDGGMNATQKETHLVWLKEQAPENTCRILSNVRCLSEGVDVPSLDAVLFLTPRNSQIDVVQSVGRVMRLAPGKQRGYIILPVVIPAGVTPEDALNDSKTYSVVWDVLQALRAHDDRFDAMVNRLDLMGRDPSKMEIVAISNSLQKKAATTKQDTPEPGTNKGKAKRPPRGAGGRGGTAIGNPGDSTPPVQNEMHYDVGELERAITAKLVKKVGNRKYWDEWANDIGKVAETHSARLKAILRDPQYHNERAAFDEFATELRDDLNNSITDDEIVEMLAQHMISKPIFDALFEKYSFASNNPMSKAMQKVLDALQVERFAKETEALQSLYRSIQVAVKDIDSVPDKARVAAGKQKIVVELYDKFFSKVFPKTQKALGIVYTPVEVVDFIIHSVNDVLKAEFGQSLGSDGVHIIDPFTGTGTFITRLLQSGLMTPEQIKKKYGKEIHANELVLLAYYIAAINIESVYHGLIGGDYVPFDGICLTDTFQMYEQEDMVDVLLEQNSARRKRQKKLDIRVIIGNPPYSAGQESANDNNGNVAYPDLDRKIAQSYVARSKATNKNALYDSYIRAIKWASGRIKDSGVIGFVTNGGFLDANTADGLRKCLAEEFSNIYVFHLRGNQRTAGEQSKREGGKIFGSGSRAPIAISILVKNPKAKAPGQILFHDIGDYLSREDKLDIIDSFGSINGITEVNGWTTIIPDDHGDWLRQRDDSFTQFIVMGDKNSGRKQPVIFENYSSGLKTQRDAWCYNSSKTAIHNNISSMLAKYNTERKRYQDIVKTISDKKKWPAPDGIVTSDSTKISWSAGLKDDVKRDREISANSKLLTPSLYRPFTKQWLYYDRRLNERVYQMPHIFPDTVAVNLVITVNQNWKNNGNITLISSKLPDLHSNGDAQCFPLYLYDGEDELAAEPAQSDIFGNAATRQHKRRDAITNEGLKHFTSAYPSEKITKEDLFYYIYGLLHSPEYCDRFADNLSKELPRIPRVKDAKDFWGFSKAGRKLAELHLNYETVPLYSGVAVTAAKSDADYRVEKMKFGKDKDRTTIVYNSKITITGIPLEAYDYVVNGKSAIDWVMERQVSKTDKDSGIVNDANKWAIETMNNPKYPLELLLRVITVSLETQKIIANLPGLDILETIKDDIS